MFFIKDIANQIRKLKDTVISLKTQQSQYKLKYDETNVKIEELKQNNDIANQISLIVQDTSELARRFVVRELEESVTKALQVIFQEPYKFCIEIENDKRKKPSAECYIVEEIDGQESKQSPYDYTAGGFVDVISTTIRFVYISLYTNPKLKSFILLDEPGKMIDKTARANFGDTIKILTKKYNKQAIIVTHDDSIKFLADHSVCVTKNQKQSNII